MMEKVMKRMKLSIAALGTAVTLIAGPLLVASLPSVAAEAGISVPTTGAEHVAEAVKYEKEASELDAKAKLHSDLAAQYMARSKRGGQQGAALRSLGNHCGRLAKDYRATAAEAREMAKSHREMAEAN